MRPIDSHLYSLNKKLLSSKTSRLPDPYNENPTSGKIFFLFYCNGASSSVGDTCILEQLVSMYHYNYFWYRYHHCRCCCDYRRSRCRCRCRYRYSFRSICTWNIFQTGSTFFLRCKSPNLVANSLIKASGVLRHNTNTASGDKRRRIHFGKWTNRQFENGRYS